MAECELCKLEKCTHWYLATTTVTVLDCKTCHRPMVVLQRHTMEPTPIEEAKMVQALTAVADLVYGPEKWYIRKKQRKIHDHLHYHAVKIEEKKE